MNWNKVTFTFITHVTCDARLVLMQKETKQKQSQCSRKWIDAEKGKLIDLILWKEEMPILSLLKFKFVICFYSDIIKIQYTILPWLLALMLTIKGSCLSF